MDELDFDFFMPVGLVKSRKVQTPSAPLDEWRIGGIASTEDEDLDGERVIQKGIDLGYLDSGWGIFNWNHRKDPDEFLGPIDHVEKLSKGLWTEGYLWQDVDRARHVHNVLTSVPPGAKSPFGFSVQGKAFLRRNGNLVKSMVREVALTHCPINQHTYADLLKSFEGKKQCKSPGCSECGECGACGNVAKTLSAGYQDPPRSGGNALRRESLLGGKDKRARKRRKRGLKDVTSFGKSMSRSDAVSLLLRRRPGLTRVNAEQVIDHVLATKED
jgi:hypothetical protein